MHDDRIHATGWRLNEVDGVKLSTLPALEWETSRLMTETTGVSGPLADMFDEFSTLITREFERNPRLMDVVA